MADLQQYNIITGQKYTKNYSQPTIKTPQLQTIDIITSRSKPQYKLEKIILPKLGYPKDHKINFQNYTSNQINQPKYQEKRMINAVSTNYNILNHSENRGMVYEKSLLQNKQATYRQDSISKICDLGRLCAPNYNADFQEIYKNNNNAFHKNNGSCTQIFEIGKGYGPRAKYFRQFK